jgi:hypothetical protein
VKVEYSIRFDRTRSQPPVPAGIQRSRRRLRARRQCRWRRTDGRSFRNRMTWSRCEGSLSFGLRLSGKRTDGCGYAVPERLFFRAERSHAPPSPWE